MPDGFIPFLMLLVITVANAEGGTSVTTERFYVPHEAACLEVKGLFEAQHTWARRTRVNFDSWGIDQATFVTSRAIATCIPMRGVQNMKNQ